ncbi:hypothetical protein RB653_010286 [Dictyostelium firmibasis]|uniref:Uncharacterized protein n=1 Tax=Dictyostelium firmibasis TaxID=79012 RepID=A0AAN7YPN0_9MYCE
MKCEDIAIIGIGFRLPSGEEKANNDSPSKLWNNLLNGFNGVVKTTDRWSDNFSKLGEITNGYAGLLPYDELKSFDPLFFGISPSEASTIDPQQRLLLKCTWEAFEDAGIDPMKLRASNTSVFVGCSSSEYRESNVNQNEQYLNIFGTYAHGTANRISYCFDLRGESMTVDTACSSSGVAVTLGRQSILSGNSDLSIIGGVNLVIDTANIKAFSYLNMLSKTGVCRPFDKDANGLVRAEGIGIVLLKKLTSAIKDGDKIYCILKGASSNVDGFGLEDKSNFYAPSSLSQATNIRLALESCNLKPKDIDYFECHGTGTPTGDPIETKGISMVFNDGTRSKENPLIIGSIKCSIGHTEAASGVISLIKCCLILKNKSLVPNINYSNPNPNIKFDEWNLKVITKPIPFSMLNKKSISIALNNFGVTGSNCCLVLSEFNKEATTNQNPNNNNSNNNKNKQYLIPFAANSIKSLEDYQQLLISKEMDVEFSKFVQIQILKKSRSLYQRSVIIASDWDQFKSKRPATYIKTSNSKSANISIIRKKPITVFVFSGQGSQYNTMALELYNNEPIFKQSMDLLDQGLSKYYGYSVLDKLRKSDSKSVHEPTIAHPSVSMFNISLFELYKHWGIEATYIVGHSLGEISAAYCSGMITLDTLCYIVYHRSIALIKTHGNGRMLSININEHQFKSNYSSKYPDIEIACYNSPTSIVIGGNEQKLNEIASDLNEKGEFSAMLGSLTAFHTSSQSATKDILVNLTIESKSADTYFFSTVTTDLFNIKTNPFDSKYVYDNILKPVKFSQTISNIYKHIESNQLGATDVVFIEIAPHPTLSYYLKQMVPKPNDSIGLKVSVYSALHKKKNDMEEIQKTISQLYCDNGYDINFISQFDDKDIDIIDCKNQNELLLPNYQWDDQKYWKVDIARSNYYNNGPAIDILGNINNNSTNTKSYEAHIDIKRKPFQYLKGHMVKGKYYFPGTGYLDNLLKIYPHQDLTVDSLDFLSPLIFVEGVNQCLQTNIYQTSTNEFNLDFHYKNQKTNQWVKSSTGTFQLTNHGSGCGFEKHSVQDIIDNHCNLTRIQTSGELYSLIKLKTGLQYTDSFKGVKKCYLGNNCSLSEISLELPIDLPDQKSFFNASILDACSHGLLLLVEDQSQLVFQKFEGLKYYASNVPVDRNQYSCIYVFTVLNTIQDDPDSFSASITIMLPDGTVLIDIENAISKSLVPVKDSLKIEYPVNELFSPYLQPLDSQIIPISTLKNLSKEEDQLKFDIIEHSIKPLLNQKTGFKIMDYDNNGDHKSTEFILSCIDKLLNDIQLFEIEIEYTIFSVNINDLKEKFSSINEKLSIVYRTSLIEKPSNYDLIVLSHIDEREINNTIDKIYKVLSPNGQLLVFSNNQDEKEKKTNLLSNYSFKEIQSINEKEFLLLQAQKESTLSFKLPTTLSYDKVIVYCSDNNKNSNIFNKSFDDQKGNEIIRISSIQEFKKLIESSKITDQTLIYFTKSIDQLEADNFKIVTYEYIQINQQLISNNLKCKHVLISLNSTCENFLSASVLGSKRYFEEYNQLQLFSLDFDQVSIENKNINSMIQVLIDENKYIQKEFIIRENKVYYERVKKETNLKKRFKSNSFEENESLMATLSPNFDYELKSKSKNLNRDEILVKINAIGLNYYNDNKIGEFSGIVEKIGTNNSEYQIGDQVFGIGYNTTSSHIVVNSNWVHKKPSNISHVEASAIPFSYLESLYSIYTVGGLKENETILVHSGSLSALNILKWKGHKSYIFVTVDSDEKKQYINDRYGSFVTGVFSSNSKEFIQQIKLKLKELGSNKQGVDLILNTLTSDYIDSNFKCLNKNGKYIDLSKNQNDYVKTKSFKSNATYQISDIISFGDYMIKSLLSLISNGIQNRELSILPTMDFSNTNTSKAIEMSEKTNKQIKTTVIENNTDILSELIKIHSEQSNYSILKSEYHIQESCLGKNILVTGQSGIVLEILKWIVRYSRNVENIIIFSKSSMKWELEYLINKNKHIKFNFKSVDISKKDNVENAIDQVLNDNPAINNIDSIFHYAFIQVTSDVMNINLDQLNVSHDAKTFGAINLHNESIRRNWKLTNFVMASSMATLAGSPQQCTYVSACSVLDSLSRYRKSIGLPSICSYYGSIKSGLVLRNESIAVALEGQGYNTVSMNKILGSLDLQIQNQKDSSNLIVSSFNFNSFKNNPHHSISVKFEHQINETISKLSINTDKNDEFGVGELIVSKISELLSLEETKLNLDIGLVDYGADSLLNGQLKNWIEKEIGQNLITIQQLQKNTINSLIQHIKKNLEKK